MCIYIYTYLIKSVQGAAGLWNEQDLLKFPENKI